jgi:hypothetical protein
MHNNVRTVRSNAVTLPVAIVLASVTGGIFPHALASPAMAQALNEPPPHVTPWTPMPVPWLRSTAPALIPSISLSSKEWTPIGPAPLAGFNHVSGRITGIAPKPRDANTIYVSAAGGGVLGKGLKLQCYASVPGHKGPSGEADSRSLATGKCRVPGSQPG